MQKSRDHYCFQMSKFITQFLRHKEVGREEDAGVPYDRIIEKCNEKLSKDSRYWPNEVKQDLKMAPHWSAQKWIDVLAKGGGQKKRFQYCLKPNCPGRHLYLRAIQGHSGRAHFWKCSYRSCIARQCTVTDEVHQVCLSRRTRKWIEINSAWRSDTRRIQH